MKNIKYTLISLVVCITGVALLSSCYTVKGAFQGAGKDVSAIAGPADNHHRYHKVKHKHASTQKKHSTTKQSTTTQPATKAAPEQEQTSTQNQSTD